MSSCAICGSNISTAIDLGPQPVCSRYLKKPDEKEYTHPLKIGQCSSCDVIQLIDPIPPKELKPIYDWITYNEAEGHLDGIADVILHLPGIKKGSTVAGTSYKDASLIKRLEAKGLTEITGPADIVLARHIVEHMHDPIKFVDGLRKKVAKGGYLLLEAPDFIPSIRNLDYSTIWEEHLFYFTPVTFRNLLTRSGMSIKYFDSFPHMLENSLVAIADMGDPSRPLNGVNDIREYARQYPDRKSSVRRTFEAAKKEGRIAFFGSGHLACVYVNFFGLKGEIEFFADDNPNKQGLYMPGSRLPVLSSKALIEKGIKLALMSVSKESEGKVVKNNTAFTSGGGRFASIFPASPMALKLI